MPKDIRFKTKPQIALDQIRAAHAEGVAPGIVLADAGYGANSDFRAGVSALNLPYVVGIQSTPSVWPPGQAPLPPKPCRGRRPCNVQRDDEHKPVSVKDLALSLGKKAWRSVTWREGSNAPLASRFATVRVHLAARDYKRTTPHPVEWLLVEWPKGEAAPTKYWLSTLPEDTPLATLVDYAKLRWRIERDYEELKGELGLSRLRRSRLAWLSPSCLHRRLRILDLRNGTRSPPQPPGGARCLAYPTVIDPEAPPIRPERHVENSIATIRKRLTVALAKSLARCPCCQSTPRRPATRLRL